MYTLGMDFELSVKQKNIIKDILDWYKEKKIPYLTLGGYAGTGDYNTRLS